MQEGLGAPGEVPDGGVDDPQQSHLEFPHLGDLQGLQGRHAEARGEGGLEEGELDVGEHGASHRSPVVRVDGIRLFQTRIKHILEGTAGFRLIL